MAKKCRSNKKLKRKRTSTKKSSKKRGRKFGSINTSSFDRIEVLGDVEGCWKKVETFLENSEIFENLEEVKNFTDSSNLKIKNGCQLIFLGDSIDNGPDNIKILTFFNKLKDANGENFISLLGNREINKLRLIEEVFNEKVDILKFRDPFNDIWSKKFKNFYNDLKKNLTGYESEVERKKIEEGNKENDAKQAKFNELLKDMKTNDKELRILKLKFLLNNSFGAQFLFSNLKTELGNKDDLYVFNYIKTDILGSKGLLTKLINKSEIIHHDIPSTSLFMHGGIHVDNFLKNHTNTGLWINNLNKWAKDIIDKIIEGSATIVDKESLFKYVEPLYTIKECSPNCIWGPDNTSSVILTRPWSKDNQADLPTNYPELIKYNINKLFVGHSPVGEIPLILKDKEDTFTMVTCDTTQNGGQMANIALIDNEKIIIKTKFNDDRKKKIQNTQCGIIESYKKELTYDSTDPYVGKLYNNFDLQIRIICKYDENTNTYLAVYFYKDVFVKPIYFLVECKDDKCLLKIT